MSPNTKKILIETESREVIRLRIMGPEIETLYCNQCQAVEGILDLNVAADLSGRTARELIRDVESGLLHSPESTNGHLVICRSSLEREINNDPSLGPHGERWQKCD